MTIGCRFAALTAASICVMITGCGLSAVPIQGNSPETATAEPTPFGWKRAAVDKHGPSVVKVQVDYCDSNSSTGSGFVVGDDLVITAAHVVNDASATRVAVPGRGLHQADVVALDAATDSALLRTKEPLGVSALTLSTDTPAPGSDVVALGYPFDAADVEVASGSVSAVDREPAPAARRMASVIMTDADADPGSSGGPALSPEGEVIGLVSSKLMWAGGVPVPNANYVVPAAYLTENLTAWSDQEPKDFVTCDEAALASLPAVEVICQHTAAEVIAKRLHDHGLNINRGSYEDAWAVFTPQQQRSLGGFVDWARASSTSQWVDLRLVRVESTGRDRASAHVILTTYQGSSHGFEGQTCSRSTIEYAMVERAGTWFIDKTTALDPEPCIPGSP